MAANLRVAAYTFVLLFLVCAAVRVLHDLHVRPHIDAKALSAPVRLDILETHSCTSGNEPGVKVASLYYAACLVFDAVKMLIPIPTHFSSIIGNNIGRLTKMMLEDGIMYFVVLSALNIVNLIFVQSRDTVLQSSAASLGYAVTMIFSSRFILNLSEHMCDGLSGDSTSRTPMSGQGGRRALHRTGTTGGGDDPMVVTVTKNVITMTDMGPEDP
ncbi:hypothetical protein B0H16DRAFT_1884773 [Mycena metata]|uniref:Uncharacterized protein n=1 Tax=Mycena metata TaxID=1033252 RepID=A0AAD7NH80_9AGAR|nr:hypothetical protein B0H16DRAFT_1884773 [Mycena metata]